MSDQLTVLACVLLVSPTTVLLLPICFQTLLFPMACVYVSKDICFVLVCQAFATGN